MSSGSLIVSEAADGGITEEEEVNKEANSNPIKVRFMAEKINEKEEFVSESFLNRLNLFTCFVVKVSEKKQLDEMSPNVFLLLLLFFYAPFPPLPLCVFGLQFAGHVEQKVLVVDHL